MQSVFQAAADADGNRRHGFINRLRQRWQSPVIARGFTQSRDLFAHGPRRNSLADRSATAYRKYVAGTDRRRVRRAVGPMGRDGSGGAGCKRSTAQYAARCRRAFLHRRRVDCRRSFVRTDSGTAGESHKSFLGNERKEPPAKRIPATQSIVTDGGAAGRSFDGPTHWRGTVCTQSTETAERGFGIQSQQRVAGRHRSTSRRVQTRRTPRTLSTGNRAGEHNRERARCDGRNLFAVLRSSTNQQCQCRRFHSPTGPVGGRRRYPDWSKVRSDARYSLDAGSRYRGA